MPSGSVLKLMQQHRPNNIRRVRLSAKRWRYHARRTIPKRIEKSDPLGTEDTTLHDLDDRIGKRIRVASRDDSISAARHLAIEHWSKTGDWSPKGLNLRPAID